MTTASPPPPDAGRARRVQSHLMPSRAAIGLCAAMALSAALTACITPQRQAELAAERVEPAAAPTSKSWSERMSFAGFSFAMPKGAKWVKERGGTGNMTFLYLKQDRDGAQVQIQLTSYRPSTPIERPEDLVAWTAKSGDWFAQIDSKKSDMLCARTQKKWEDEVTVATNGNGGAPYGTGVYADMEDFTMECLHPLARGRLVTFRYVARTPVGKAFRSHVKQAHNFLGSVRFEG